MQRLDVLLAIEKLLGHKSPLEIGAVAARAAILLGLSEQAFEIAGERLKAGGWLTVGSAVISGEHGCGEHRRITVPVRDTPVPVRSRSRMIHQQGIAGRRNRVGTDERMEVRVQLL